MTFLLHHNDYISKQMLRNKHLEVRRGSDETSNKDNIKLVPNLINKAKNFPHYLNLRFYIEQASVSPGCIE